MADPLSLSRPNDAALADIAEKAAMRRKLLAKAKWLCDELETALQALSGLLEAAGLGFKPGQGRDPSIIVFPTQPAEHSSQYIDAYSIKMLARSLGAPQYRLLAATVPSARREARKLLIETLERLFELISEAERSGDTKHSGRTGRVMLEPAAPAPATPQLGVAERREAMRAELLRLRKIKTLSEQQPQAFQDILEHLSSEVENGTLLPSAVTGKALDLAYSHRNLGKPAPPPEPETQAEPETGPAPEEAPAAAVEIALESKTESEASSAPEITAEAVPPVPETLLEIESESATFFPAETTAETAPAPAPELVLELETEPASTPASETTPETASPPTPAPAPEPEPETSTAKLPERLNNWSGQGLEGNRLFRLLKADGDLERRIAQWHEDGKPPPIIERMFVRYFLIRVKRFRIEGQEFVFELPDSLPPPDCAAFEQLVEEGKETGSYGVDPRIWGVIGSAFRFLKNAFAPALRD